MTKSFRHQLEEICTYYTDEEVARGFLLSNEQFQAIEALVLELIENATPTIEVRDWTDPKEKEFANYVKGLIDKGIDQYRALLVKRVKGEGK